jgi:ABC-2 type transport system permease protein
MKKSRFAVLKAFFKKEILQVLRDPRMRLVLFVAPLVQLIIFGVALSSETKNVRIAVWSAPNDVGLIDLYQRAISTKWFLPAQVSGSDPFEWVRAGEADAVLIAPQGGLERDRSRNGGHIQFLINAQNSTRAQSIESYMRSIMLEVYGSQTDFGLQGLRFEVRSLYNPTFETSMFMVPGVLSMLVCLVTILLTSMSVAREREIGTIETLTAAPIDTLDLVLGKSIPFIFLGSLQALLILVFGVLVFNLPVRGPLWMLALSTVLMLFATVSIGLLISTISKNQQQAVLGGFMYLFPSYLLSGLMFPIDNMPIYIKPFAYINPLTHYMGVLRNILLIGGDLSYFLIHSSILGLIAIGITTLAYRRFKSMLS